MSPTLNRLRDGFDRVVELPPAEREAWLAANVADADEREALRQLLDADASHGVLDVPALELGARIVAAEIHSEDLIGRRIGAFRIVRALGQGGMAAVFLGERVGADFTQQVAIKLLRRGLYSELEQRLFQRERRILAALDHPHIARLIDGGVTEAGVPYLVMEFVDGVPITRSAEQRALDLPRRLRLFALVCRAVEAAHQRLIVHRDIKPSNILVNADGEPKLLDFGIAKLIEPDADDATGTAGIYTPGYAAPEQTHGGAITTATDVYALGVLLHELLLGRRPEIAADGEARRPSSCTDAAGAQTAPQLRRALRGDLDNIALKALESEPPRRYASAGALADDIERHLDGRPVQAHPPTRWYRARKFVRRHRGGVTATAILALGMFAALALALWQAGVARREAQRAEQQASIATAAQGFLADIFNANSGRQADPVKARNTTARELLELGAKKIDGEMNDAPGAKLHMLMLLGRMHSELGLAEQAATLYRKALALAQQTHGEYAPEAFAAQISLAHELHLSSSDEAAAQVLEQAQRLLDHNRDEDPDRRAQLYDQLAQYYAVRDLPRALDYARKATVAYEKLPDSVDKGQFFSRKAFVENNGGFDANAVASYQRAIDIARTVGGERNPDLVIAYAQLADVQLGNRDIAAAERNLRHALELAKAINGDAHVDVIQCETRLGRLLADSGRLPEGLAMLDEAKRGALALLGPDEGFHLPQVLFQHGVLLLRRGLVEDALVDLDAAVANRRRHRPGTIPLAMFLESAAAAQIEMGRFAAAGRNLDEARTILDKVGQKPPSESYDAYLAHSVRLALAQGRSADAGALLRDLSPARPGSDGLGMQEVSNTLLTAGAALAAGRHADAIALASDLRSRIERSALANYYGYSTAQTRFVEGLARLRAGDARAAQPLLRQALAARQQSLDPASAQIAQAQIALAESDLALGDVASARALANAAAAIHAAHAELGPQYRAPLQHLLAGLAAAR